MLTQKRSDFSDDIKFWIFFSAWAMAGYLLYEDRFIPYNAIWNNHLWLLLGLFVFGFVYRFDFFIISFWLMLTLGLADLVMGINLSLTGPSCWSGFAVWLLTILAGLAGCLSSYLFPWFGHARQSHKTFRHG